MGISKSLTCSVDGMIHAKVEYDADDIENAIEAAQEGRDKLGLQILCMENPGSNYQYAIELRKTDTPEHFKDMAKEAKALGWH